MSVAAPATAVWIDGKRRSSGDVHISALDRGLTLADGVFETMPAFGGTVFRLDQHLRRLEGALATLGIPSQPMARDWVVDAVRSADVGDASVRLTVTRGAAPGGVAPPSDVRPTVIVSVGPMPAFPSSIYEHGLVAHVASGRRNEHAMTAGLKTLAYTDAVLALIEARRSGADDALFLDTAGHCSEGSSSNLFAWTGDSLLTPPLSCAALPGITRAAVLELAQPLGVHVEECVFGLDVLLEGEEAFLTSSLRGLAPLVRVGGHAIGTGKPGDLTRRFMAAYANLIALECSL
jgi:branched-chain amino acid aminotransferase